MKMPIPKHPYPPHDHEVSWMGEADGPFRCDHCKFFKGQGNRCPWVDKLLKNGDCCNHFEPK